MIIREIIFENFKPYYSQTKINLETTPEQNVVLIGGRNGQGKTSFLVGVVWCLYGKNMSLVDEIFSKEIKGNYNQWLSKSLNWQAKHEGNQKFSVKVVLKDVELSSVLTKNEQLGYEISLKRTVDFSNSEPEQFEILIDGKEDGLLRDEAEQINFINDFIIPIDIAKFVFFDAEKISEIASLDSKDRALLMDKSFGQVLGLNTYSELIQDLKTYEQDLKRQNVDKNIDVQISSFEGAIKTEELTLAKIEKEINWIEEEIEKFKVEDIQTTNHLIRRGDVTLNVNIDQLRVKENELNEKLEEASQKFNELSDLIPLAIIGYKLEEVQEHLNKEEELKRQKISDESLKEKTKEFAEKLFNRPDFPPRDLDMEQKVFYYNKAKSILSEIYTEDQNIIDLEFEHDLHKSEVDHLNNVLSQVSRHSKDSFESIFNDYIRIQNDLLDAQKSLRMAESTNQDEFIQGLQDKKKEIERELTKLYENRGKFNNEKETLRRNIENSKVKIENLLSKVQTSKKIEAQINIAQKYIKALEKFIVDQKQIKLDILQKTLLKEIKAILNKNDLVSSVELSFVPIKDNYGLEVKLFNKQNQETNPNSDMSKGEQQLYVSALLKAVLAESIHNLPVFIDTPLGRIDQEHRDNILERYYPNLADQVIIFSTNTEIRTSDLPKIESHIAKKYRLENLNNKTIIHPEYF